MLEVETAFFEEHQAEWAREHPGKFVLVKAREVTGFYDSREDALVAGARCMGLVSFLVRHVSDPDEPVTNPAMSVGVLSANPPPAV